MRRLSIGLSALALALAPAAASASATAGTSPSPPRLLEERGLLVWNPSSGREHLLISAQMEAEGPAAMIVEVPLAPAVEAVETETEAAILRLLSLSEGEAPAVIEPPPPREPAHVRVLQASDAGSLGGFLDAHRLAPYEGLSAFARSFGGRAFYYVALSLPSAPEAPRTLPWTAISFRTPRPFYPLATPEELLTSEDGRRSSLEIYTLSPERLAMTSKAFDSGLTLRLSRADLERTLGEALLSSFGFDDPGASYWLQRFEVERLPLGEDGFFVRIPEPVPQTISESATVTPRSRQSTRFLIMGAATALAISLAWLISREPSRSLRRG